MKQKNIPQGTNEEIKAYLTELRMPGAREKFEELVNMPSSLNLTTLEFMSVVLKHEVNSRLERRNERFLKESGLRRNACFAEATLDNILYTQGRKLNKDTVDRLVACDWIRQANPPSVIISGPSGTGKTWLVNLIGRCACEQSIQVYYIRFSELLERLQDANDHHESANYRRSLSLKKLLIIDDFGIGTVTKTLMNDFLSLMEARMCIQPTIIAGQLALKDWYNYFGEGLCTDALMDRLTNYSYLIELEGSSLRELRTPEI